MKEPRPRILIVDDEPNVLATLQPIFALEGYHVDVAASEGEARRAIGDGVYDAVITDLRLADADGLSIVDRLQKERPETPAIILTGFASLESAIEAMHKGAYDYLLKPCDVDELKGTVRRAIEHGRVRRELYEQVAALEALAGPRRGRDGETQRTLDEVQSLVAQLDATKRELGLALARERATVARLRELDELKSEFISNVSHELRTPLTSLRGYTTLLERRLGKADEGVQNALQAMSRATDQLRRLIEDLIDMAAIEAGKLRIVPEPVHLPEAVSAAALIVAPMAQEKQLELITKVPSDISPVLVDPSRLGQVLNNLLINAVKFTPAGGKVSIEAREGAGVAHLSVSDTGVGIPPGEHPKVFSRFFRASTGPESSQRGLGLGLAICRAIVEAHSGVIWLDSEPGRGTTVHFTVPLADGEQAARRSKEAQASQLE